MSGNFAQILPEKSNKDYIHTPLFEHTGLSWTSLENKETEITRKDAFGYHGSRRNLIIEVEGYVLELPIALREIKNEIEKSKYILDLPNDWDDEGSPSYKKGVYINAIDFIVKYAKHIWEETSSIIDAPSILHGPQGSIDILWNKRKYKLLINIPNNSNIATFYGYDSKKQTEIKGKFNYKLVLNIGLILWLNQIKNT